jgi:hypothetical protein
MLANISLVILTVHHILLREKKTWLIGDACIAISSFTCYSTTGYSKYLQC